MGPLQRIPEREMGDKVTKEGEHVAGKPTSHQENNSLEFQNIFSLQYLLPHFSHLISTSLMHFSHFGGEVKDSSRLSTLAKATHGNEWEGRISNCLVSKIWCLFPS